MNLSEVHSLSPAFPDVDERRKRYPRRGLTHVWPQAIHCNIQRISSSLGGVN